VFYRCSVIVLLPGQWPYVDLHNYYYHNQCDLSNRQLLLQGVTVIFLEDSWNSKAQFRYFPWITIPLT